MQDHKDPDACHHLRRQVRAINSKNNRQILQDRHRAAFRQKHVVKNVLYNATTGRMPADAIPGGHGYGMFFSNADIPEAIGIPFGKMGKTGSSRHRRNDHRYILMLRCNVDDCVAEYVRESRFILYVTDRYAFFRIKSGYAMIILPDVSLPERSLFPFE